MGERCDPHCYQPRTLRQGFSYELKGQSARAYLATSPRLHWLSLLFATLAGEHRGAPRRREHTREEGGPDLRHDGQGEVVRRDPGPGLALPLILGTGSGQSTWLAASSHSGFLVSFPGSFQEVPCN